MHWLHGLGVLARLLHKHSILGHYCRSIQEEIMLPFPKDAEHMSNVASLSKVNLPPSITLTTSVMFFYPKLVHKHPESVGKRWRKKEKKNPQLQTQ